MTHDERVFYVYGLVRDGFDASRLPSGLDDAPVTLTKSGHVAALTSRLPAGAYAAAEIERNSGDVSWLSPRAMAHDNVLTWAQEHGGVIPLPMFSLWGSEKALSKSLEQEAARLAAVFDRVSGADEFGVRIHRRDAAMMEAIDDLDPAMAELRGAANAAAPGQRYLLERKLAEQGKQAVRQASQRMAKQIFDELKALSRQAAARPLVPDAGKGTDATIVLNGAFLVDRKRVDEFRAKLGAQVREYQPRGLAFDFTGPWPPYNFVADQGSTALMSR